MLRSSCLPPTTNEHWDFSPTQEAAYWTSHYDQFRKGYGKTAWGLEEFAEPGVPPYYYEDMCRRNCPYDKQFCGKQWPPAETIPGPQRHLACGTRPQVSAVATELNPPLPLSSPPMVWANKYGASWPVILGIGLFVLILGFVLCRQMK
jgi:hypothetical protein